MVVATRLLVDSAWIFLGALRCAGMRLALFGGIANHYATTLHSFTIGGMGR